MCINSASINIIGCVLHYNRNYWSNSTRQIDLPPYSLPQGSVVSQAAIDQAYDELLQQTEKFLVELQSRQEQQRIEEEEAEKMRKIKEEQVRI